MFGRKSKEQKAAEHKQKVQQKEIEHRQKMHELEKKGLVYYAKYLGGLKRYPLEQHAKLIIYPDRIELTPMNVVIPYTELNNIESIPGGKLIDGTRIAELGVVGIFWQKNRLNTILEYTDEQEEAQTLVLDLRENVKYIQPRIYDHMISARTTSKES